MIIEPDLWRRIKDQVKARRDHEANLIVGGSCKTLESYANHIGFVRGLDWVLGLADELQRPEPETETTEANE